MLQFRGQSMWQTGRGARGMGFVSRTIHVCTKAGASCMARIISGSVSRIIHVLGRGAEGSWPTIHAGSGQRWRG